VYYKNGKQCRELERVVANTPGDLSNRKNRYGYWNSVCGTDANNASYVDVGNMQGLGKLHGNYGAWYWLRLPTLQESATFRPSTQSWNNLSGYLHSFRAGVPFGGMLDGSYWRGINQTLEAAYTPVTSFTTTANVYLGGNALPLTPLFDSNGVVTTRYPFLDFWNNPNCWEQVSRESGDLLYSQAGFNSGDMGSSNNSQANLNSDTRTNTWGGGQGETYSQDVILTNVLSFNVKVWDDSTRQFVEMGGQFSLGSFWDHLTQFASANTDHVSYLSSFHKDFKTIGFYRPFNFTNNKTVNNSNGSHILAPFLPAVYDTWTEQYELERLYNYKVNNGVTYSPEQNLSDIPTEGSIPSVVLTHFPPPYDLPLKAVQIELRAFDPKLKIIRNMTFQVDFPSF
ncbi:MAG: hypothetical protein PHQ75_14425, partial [Thermoguttaceae bacterium]|nr:hypothetical protein [Thermoguttaceae bacterium]